MIKGIVLVFFVLLSVSGCGRDVSDLEKKVLERDPSFQEVMDLKYSIAKDLEETKNNYFQQKRAREGQIASIKQELGKNRGEYIARLERIKKKLLPEITSLKNNIKGMKREIVIKNSEIKAIEKSISEIKELVQKGKNLEMTQEEMRMWNERMTSLVRKRENAVREKDIMLSDIDTAEMKIIIMTRK